MPSESSNKSPFLNRLMTDRSYQFWALNIFGWSGYGFIVSLSAFLWKKENLTVQLIYALIATLSGLLLTLIMRRAFRAIWSMAPLPRGFVALAVVIAMGCVWGYLKMMGYVLFIHMEEKEHGFAAFLGWFAYSFYILLCWAALYFGIKFSKMLAEEQKRSLKAQSMAHEAQLKMLRYQLNPHFLFNTLNAISTLILDNKTPVANTMVTELSKFLRYSLQNDPMQKVSLAQEVNALELYLNIEKVRFGDRLRLNIDVQEKAMTALIPSLLLQPLVENSIKYAVSKSIHGGAINVAAKVFADELFIEVSDDGPGIQLDDGELPYFSGVGLRNFRERLSEIYRDKHGLKFSQAEPQGLKVNIRIPYQPASN